MQRVAIGVMIYNEATNLPRLLPLLAGLGVEGAQIEQIVLVSSGSTDGSDAIIQRWAAREPRFTAVIEPERRGKAAAVNRFLAELPPEIEICALVGADTLPEPGALQHLLSPFSDPRVGMTGARPTPTNSGSTWVDRVVRFQWALHHRVASRSPKLGEMVAFRRLFVQIPADTAVDEATLEAMVTGGGYRLAYAPDARVRNRGPATLGELLEQRQRIWAGHLWLRRETRYEVATYRMTGLLRPALAELRAHPGAIPVAAAAAAIELAARGLGAWRVYRRGAPSPAWQALPSTKDPLG